MVQIIITGKRMTIYLASVDYNLWEVAMKGRHSFTKQMNNGQLSINK